MPLLHLEQVNDAPIPVAQQADATNPGKWTTRNSGPNGDGKTFSITQLLEDISVPFLKRKESTVGLDPYEAAKAQAVNGIKDQTLNSIGSDPAYQDNRDQWLNEWNTAFQLNPGQDLSKLISDNLWKLIDPSGPGKYSDFVAAMKKSKTGLTELLVSAVDEVMKDLPNVVTRKAIDFNSLETVMSGELEKVLQDFNLDATEDAADPDVIAFEELKDKANEELDRTFESLNQIRPDRPYRLGFDQDTIEAAVKGAFRASYSTTEWANRLATAAQRKAETKLAEILKGANADNLDTRILDVIQDFNTWAQKQPDPKPVIPPEMFKPLFGDDTGKKVTDWMTKWASLLVFSNSESVVPDQKTGGEKVVIGIGVSLRDGATPITGSPQLKVSRQWLDAAGRSTKEDFITTQALDVTKSSYSTDLALEAFNKAVANIKPTTSLSEDNFKAFLAKQSPFISIADLKTGHLFKDVSLADLKELNPEIFKDFNDEINKAKANAEKQQYAIGTTTWTSDLKITFDIEYVLTNGVMQLHITPHIIDKNIGKIPHMEWDTSIPASIKAKDSTKQKIVDLFTDADNLHIEIDKNHSPTIVEKVVAPLYSKSTEIYEALSNPELFPFPFIAEYDGKLAKGEEVSLKFMEDNYPLAKKALQYFEDSSSRFKIKFVISEVDVDEKRMSVTYTITDSTVTDKTDPFYSTDISNKEDKNKLEVKDITFNPAKNKAATWLEDLEISDRGEFDKFNDRKYVEAIGARKPLAMTDEEFKAIFKDWDGVRNSAKSKDDVTIVKGKVEYNKETERWEQFFEASYDTKDGKHVSEQKGLPFTERFLSQDEVKTVEKEVDDKVTAAQELADKSSMTTPEKQEFSAELNAEASALQDQIDSLTTDPTAPDMHEQQAAELMKIADGLEQKAKDAIRESMLKQVKGDIVKHFGDVSKVPPKILELLAKYPDQMMQIVKNNPGLLDNIPKLIELLEKYGDNLDGDKIMSAQKSLQQSGKWFLLGLGGLLGIGGILGGANAVKVATTNKKSISSTGKIKSSKKLAIISALIGLASAAGSVATLVYLFVVQGGL